MEGMAQQVMLSGGSAFHNGSGNAEWKGTYKPMVGPYWVTGLGDKSRVHAESWSSWWTVCKGWSTST